MSKFNEIINSKTPVLIDFYADWCVPCKMMKPILHDVKKTLGDKIKIIKIDVDKNPVIANKYAIRSVPTIMLFKNGNLHWNKPGVVRSNQLIDIIKSVN